MSIGQETGRRLGGRQRMDAAQFMIAAALTIMALALVLAAAAVQAAPLTMPVPEGPAAGAGSAPMLLLQEPDGALTPLAPEEGRVTARVNPSTARVTLSYRFRAGPGALRSGVYLLPLRHPGPVAKQVSTLDHLSEGRLIFGVGVGGEFPREYALAGVPLEERGARLSEGIAVLRKLWSGEKVAHEGRFYPFPEVQMLPPARQYAPSPATAPRLTRPPSVPTVRELSRAARINW